MKQLFHEQPQRIHSVDILRGLVMVLMAIDHVRVYAGVPAGGYTADLFFTRWVTHFCAPTFAFFAGTSAFLYGRKIADKSRLMKFLLTRGLLLVILELTIVRFFWTFSLDYSSFVLAGVIWMLGWCMVLLSLFIRLKPYVIGIIGVLIIAFQQIFSHVPKLFPESMQSSVGSVWAFFYPSDFEPLGNIAVLYVLIPWVGIMMAGYGFGLILLKKPALRDKICLAIGLTAIVIFAIVGSRIVYYSNTPDNPMPLFFRLLNQSKYPPSQLYVLMTLGPIIALVPVVERVKGWLTHILAVFGRVPMFYYLMHILLIHISALIVNYLRDGATHQEWYTTAPFAQVPETNRWPLSLLYLVFLVDVVILYVKCSWYAKYKEAHSEKGWLKYL
ncbi:DUF1624 domain-containing protein [Emticicia sp. BO119]|uniref:DUF1624 domain-containing protein n=1 Tax=Emticicia sp. BO119 TaxID=2757768 RepID=UPI0015F0B127|nr:heparan-alpha-glucosaminide N-acetyltransferase domain-containing protein [Emticicia sp. BO119]MBA4853778.1 DUF1624 domain-containing protein [Emticicia sp. BO119]